MKKAKKLPINKMRVKRVLPAIALGLCISSMTSPALAAPTATGATLQDVVNAVNTFNTSLVGTTLTPIISMYKELVQAVDTTWFTIAETANNSLATAQVPGYVSTHIDSKTLQKMAQVLSQASMGTLTTALATLPASDTNPSSAKSTATVAAGASATDSNAGVNDQDRILYAGSLMKDSYNETNDQNRAEQAIAFLSGYATPLSNIDLSALTDDQKKQMNESPQGQAYRLHIRNLAAMRSLILYNLYHIMMERMPVKGLAQTAGLTSDKNYVTEYGKDANDTSPLVVERYVATHRVNSSDWYNYMNTAPQIVVQRETLYVLAEMEKTLYQIKQQNDLILLTLTATAMQGLNASQLFPDKSENELRSTLGLQASGPLGEATDKVTSAVKDNKDSGQSNSDQAKQLMTQQPKTE